MTNQYGSDHSSSWEIVIERDGKKPLRGHAWIADGVLTVPGSRLDASFPQWPEGGQTIRGAARMMLWGRYTPDGRNKC